MDADVPTRTDVNRRIGARTAELTVAIYAGSLP